MINMSYIYHIKYSVILKINESKFLIVNKDNNCLQRIYFVNNNVSFVILNAMKEVFGEGSYFNENV